MGRGIVVCGLVGAVACGGADEEAPPGSTSSSSTEEVVETRPDLTACSEREAPVVEWLFDAPSTSWEHEDIPLCPGDQLAIDLVLSGATSRVEVVVEGSLEGLELVRDLGSYDEVVAPEGDGWVLRPHPEDVVVDVCEQWTAPFQLSASDDAEPVRFDVRFVASGETCGGTG